jgi:hypothetical protein
MTRPFRGRVLWISLVSGCLWGAIGYYLLFDGGLRGGAAAGLMVSPLIGLIPGYLANRFDPVDFSPRALVALFSLYAASALFVVAATVWIRVFHLESAPAEIQRAGPVWAIVGTVVDGVWLGTFSGILPALWPVSFANHLLIWQRPKGEPLVALDPKPATNS